MKRLCLILPRLALVATLLPLLVSLTGCSLLLDLHGGAILNLRAQASSSSGRSAEISELMELAIFQLKTIPEDKQRALLNKVGEEWPKFRTQLVTDRAKGTFPESFAPFLAYPATLIELKRPDEVFVINPRSRLQREVPIGISTSHLLVITLGSVRGLRSVQLFDVGLTTGSVSLCFYEYDVQKFDPGKPWSCPVAPLP